MFDFVLLCLDLTQATRRRRLFIFEIRMSELLNKGTYHMLLKKPWTLLTLWLLCFFATFSNCIGMETIEQDQQQKQRKVPLIKIEEIEKKEDKKPQISEANHRTRPRRNTLEKPEHPLKVGLFQILPTDNPSSNKAQQLLQPSPRHIKTPRSSRSPRVTHSEKPSPRYYLTPRGQDVIDFDDSTTEIEREPLIETLGQFQSALTPYRSNRGSTQFIDVLDKGFFDPPFSWALFSAGALGTFCGLIPSSPATGMLMYLTGDFLKLPHGQWTIFFPISTTMVTLTPVFARQFYERARIIATGLSGYKRFETEVSVPLGNEKTYSWEIGFKQSFPHHLLNGYSFLAASFRALCYTGILVLAEKNFPIFTGITGPFFFLSFLEQYYALGVHNLHHLFEDKEPGGKFSSKNQSDGNKVMESHLPISYQEAEYHRNHLLLMIQEFQNAMEDNKELTEEAFETINEARNTINGKEWFTLSGLLLKPAQQKEKNISLTQSANSLLHSSPLTKIDNFLNYMHILCKGGTMIVRPIVMEYMLERVGTEFFNISPDVAIPLACAGAGLELVFKIIMEYKAVKGDNIQRISLANFSKHLSLARILTFPPAGFFTLAGVFLGWQNMSRWGTPTLLKAQMMIPYIVDDLPSQSEFLTSKLQGLITAAVTTLPEYMGECAEKYSPHWLTMGGVMLSNCFSQCIPTFFQKWTERYKQRSWLRKWSGDLYNCVETAFDTVTIASLYMTTQFSRNKPKEQNEDDLSFYEESFTEVDPYTTSIIYSK